ncbi:MAG: hypothetical protein AABX04_05225 [Nanoarchaeota archaeon]
MTTPRTVIVPSRLEYWCQQLPECRTFLENFFISCRPYSMRVNTINYSRDISRCIEIEPQWKAYQRNLMRAFAEIAFDQASLN